MLQFDHIAIACTDLQQGADWVHDRLGVPLVPGGRHDYYGTHNMLLGLGDIYLEVIALDPTAHRVRPTWFDLDNFTGPPRIANWICRINDWANAPAQAGEIVDLQRGDLNWQITVPADGSLPRGGAYPTLIRWAPGTRRPAERLPDSHCRLTSLSITDATPVSGLMDTRIHYATGDATRFHATFDTPNGPRTLS